MFGILYMLKFKLRELLTEKQFREGKATTMVELSQATGIHRSTLSALANFKRDANPTIEVIDKLCQYFGCPVEQLVEHIPDDHVPK